MKIFHYTPEGCMYRPGVNGYKAPGWFRIVFFCGECRLYFRLRWKIGSRWAPRAFLRWDLRKNEEKTVWWREDENGVWVKETETCEIEKNSELRSAAEGTPITYVNLDKI